MTKLLPTLILLAAVTTGYNLHAQGDFVTFSTTYQDAYANKYPGALPKTPSPQIKYLSTYKPEGPFVPTPVTYVQSSRGSVPLTAPGQLVTCDGAISGNTVKMQSGDAITLLGVDLPSQPVFNRPEAELQSAAMQFTSSTLAGKKVRLEYEAGARDQYGRLLAYVILENGTCVNELIIKSGYGVAHRQFPYKLQKRYGYLENMARQAHAGLWQK